MNKRFIAAFLISCIMISIAGCNKTPAGTTTESSEVTESTEDTTISDKTVNSAKVYVNKKGKTSWWVKKMNLGAGADYYEVFGTI